MALTAARFRSIAIDISRCISTVLYLSSFRGVPSGGSCSFRSGEFRALVLHRSASRLDEPQIRFRFFFQKDMAGRFDISLGRVDKGIIWVETVEGFGHAYELMTKLAAKDPGPYFIISQGTHITRGSINTSNSKAQTSSSRVCVRAKNVVPFL